MLPDCCCDLQSSGSYQIATCPATYCRQDALWIVVSGQIVGPKPSYQTLNQMCTPSRLCSVFFKMSSRNGRSAHVVRHGKLCMAAKYIEFSLPGAGNISHSLMHAHICICKPTWYWWHSCMACVHCCAIASDCTSTATGDIASA